MRDWLLGLPPSAQTGAAEGINQRHRLAVQFMGALAAGVWAAALPQGSARDEAMKQFTFTWAKHDASKVTAWLNKLPADSGKSAAATGLAFSIFDTDPDAALSWTRVIRDEPERMRTLGNAWRQWRSKKSSAATSWLDAATDLSEAERAALQDGASQ